MRIFIDTNIPMYAAGTEHALRLPSQNLILAIARGEVDGVTDAEVFQEILHRYGKIGARDLGLRVFDGFARVMEGRVFPITMREMEGARTLTAGLPRLGPRDLVHLAVMREHGVQLIATADKGFDLVPGLRRISIESHSSGD